MVAFAVLFFLLCFSYPSYAQKVLESLEKEIANLIYSSQSSVVTIASRFSQEVSSGTESGIFSFFKAETPKRSLSYVHVGSGIVFDEAGHILTRSSIVGGAESNRVTLSDGRQYAAIFVGEDPETGFAIIKINGDNLTSAQLGDSNNLFPGAWNLMIGNSLGVYPSVVLGSINGFRNDGMIQISANLNPGNNGSPIFNTKGEVIGLVAGQMNTQESVQSFFGNDIHATILAYPINRIKKIADDIIQHGRVRHGWLGVVGNQDGKIREIKKDSPAQIAGLTKGDVIVKFSNKEVNNISELARLVKYTRPGETVSVDYERDGEIMHASIQIGEWNYQARTEPNLVTGKPKEAPRLTLKERDQRIMNRINELEKELMHLKKLIEAR